MDHRNSLGAFAIALHASSLLAGPAGGAVTEGSGSFSREQLIEFAEQLTTRPYEPPPVVPEAFTSLGYDAYRDIQSRPAQRLWRGKGLGFQVDFMHAGYLFKQAVEVYEVVDGVPAQIEYDPGLFTFGPAIPPVPAEAPGMFSGIRLYAPIDVATRYDEFLVFQGASYYRARGAGQGYGLSARGLAINTGEPQPEEFPIFRRFWIERPEPETKTVTVHALLDGRSVVGAFTFRITPGEQTRMHVKARVFPRRDIDVIGLAPLTSMFLFGPTNRHRFDDFRSEVHDSDGLLMETSNGSWVWRPLRNPRALQRSLFPDENPKGFGLLQRQRELDQYHDWHARYDRRPSAWVEPTGEWGQGSIELVEIPTQREYADNIVAFWRPDKPVREGQPLNYSYRLSWGRPRGNRELAQIAATRSGLTMIERRQFVVEFTPPKEKPSPHDGGPPTVFDDRVQIDATATRGRIRHPVGAWNSAAGRYRVTFQLDTGEIRESQLELVLRRAGKVVSETWRYRWSAE